MGKSLRFITKIFKFHENKMKYKIHYVLIEEKNLHEIYLRPSPKQTEEKNGFIDN